MLHPSGSCLPRMHQTLCRSWPTSKCVSWWKSNIKALGWSIGQGLWALPKSTDAQDLFVSWTLLTSFAILCYFSIHAWNWFSTGLATFPRPDRWTLVHSRAMMGCEHFKTSVGCRMMWLVLVLFIGSTSKHLEEYRPLPELWWLFGSEVITIYHRAMHCEVLDAGQCLLLRASLRPRLQRLRGKGVAWELQIVVLPFCRSAMLPLQIIRIPKSRLVSEMQRERESVRWSCGPCVVINDFAA